MIKLSNNMKQFICVIISILSILMLPNFLYDRETDIIRSDCTIKTVRAGETVNFSLFFIKKGGFLNEEEYKLTNFIAEGDWDTNIDETIIKVPPNSRKELIFTIDIPDTAEDGDYFYYQFDLTSTSRSGPLAFTVKINNSVSSEISEGYISEVGKHSSFQPSIFSIIPIIIIIICIFFLIKLHREAQAGYN